MVYIMWYKKLFFILSLKIKQIKEVITNKEFSP